jgi:type II secretion system protein G
MTKQKGFTLIELLIVVAIIGLLATLAIVSLTSAQQRARDTKRVADIKALQVALELNWNENAEYPTLDAAGTNTWAELSTALNDFMSAAPVDPDNDDGTAYTYIMDPATNNLYYLQADLENIEHNSLDQDVDGAAGTAATQIPGAAGWTSLTSLDTFDDTDATVSCEDATGLYCLRGDATN